MDVTGSSLVDGNNFIRHHLKNNKLFAAGKMGVTEAKILYFYSSSGKFEDSSVQEGYLNSGIFPKTEEALKYFCNTYVESLKVLDLAPRWCKCVEAFEENLYKNTNPKCYNTLLSHLEPYYFNNPWTDFLDNKTVLVISPFTNSIETQFEKFDKIWNGKIKKNFKLKTLKFPFSVGISDEMLQYDSYQSCLEDHIDKVSKIDFDFAILGCGAYALPLCSYIKNTMHKSSIHLGGATQILFGIKGSRWLSHPKISKFFNDYWIRPSGDELPSKHKANEDGCYW
jgi:hypothetical protein